MGYNPPVPHPPFACPSEIFLYLPWDLALSTALLRILCFVNQDCRFCCSWKPDLYLDLCQKQTIRKPARDLSLYNFISQEMFTRGPLPNSESIKLLNHYILVEASWQECNSVNGLSGILGHCTCKNASCLFVHRLEGCHKMHRLEHVNTGRLERSSIIVIHGVT